MELGPGVPGVTRKLLCNMSCGIAAGGSNTSKNPMLACSYEGFPSEFHVLQAMRKNFRRLESSSNHNSMQRDCILQLMAALEDGPAFQGGDLGCEPSKSWGSRSRL